MEFNSTVIGIGIIIILAFIYFVIKRNKKDQKNMENELNQAEIKPDKHEGDKI